MAAKRSNTSTVRSLVVGLWSAFVSAASCVSILLKTSRPPAIRRLVIAVWIRTIERLLGRPLSHVGQEGAEGLTPFSTYADAAASVVPELRGVRVVAAGQHRYPGRVGLGCSASAHMAVRQSVPLQPIQPATARLRAAVAKVVRCHLLGSTAVALAQPDDVSPAGDSEASDNSKWNKGAEAPSGQVGWQVLRWGCLRRVFRPALGETPSHGGFIDHATNLTMHCGCPTWL